ncbi:PREDICTED: HAUS augmin-like complex subunit 8 [Gekko japonicus]|uniref:HAUS augmin-like complex subunit 8 n=1 Tax=Gekko japonicus TaxID=146911 RepID=A0ABM1L890_GEKJA|nr:PREDICTED: HAUS augmin-like complex subunit 8 [Gekko japonicus]
MAENAPGAKVRGGRIVPSRYLQYDRKTTGKADISQSLMKEPERAASAKRPPTQLQKQKNTSEMTFRVLHSTVLEDHGNAQPDLDFSVISDKTRPAMPLPKPNPAVKGTSRKQLTQMSPEAENLARLLESQNLLLTYASVKMEKYLATLEEKAERNLLALSEECEKLQREAHRKKRRLLQLKKKQDLSEALDRQLEVLAPVAERCARFHEEYKHFATALDSTRHELPLKEIHVGENQHQYLADMQEQLIATQNILKQYPQEHLEDNAQVLAVMKELEEASLKLNDELPRSFATVLSLSADVSKEISLHHQKSCEDTLGLEAMKQYYFP